MTRKFKICTPHQNIISMNRSRRITWGKEGHLARKGGNEMQTVLVGKREAKRPRRRYTRRWENNITLSRLGPGAEAGSCGHSTEPSGYKKKKKCEEFLECLSNY